MFSAKQFEEQNQQFCVVESNLKRKLTVMSKRNLEWEKCIRQAIGRMVEKIKQVLRFCLCVCVSVFRDKRIVCAVQCAFINLILVT